MTTSISGTARYDDPAALEAKLGAEDGSPEELSRALLEACARPVEMRYQMIDMLLARGADPTLCVSSGATALHILLVQSRWDRDRTAELTRRFIEAGCDINQVDYRDRTPLLSCVLQQGVKEPDREPVYEIMFARPELDLDLVPGRQKSVRDWCVEADRTMGRPVLMEYVHAWDARHGRPEAT